MSPKQLISFFQTQAAAARALGCAQSTIAEWVAAGSVPDGRQYQAQLATNGQLRADRPALRVRATRRTPKQKEVAHG
ncbi:Cro/CI family transcriptional regulator [Comamonas odontotermitis]|uniref:Cro/CI family transcriptional regulator n=1 Tax=Comamonas odontotermitis TaxID=379895 RepID=UPI001CC54ED1|nr:Cro/Cl family transcriptional regulator [Comamonas odontotermitis]